MGPGGGDESHVIEPVRRVTVFERLLDRPMTRTELKDELGVSRATLHRIATFLTDHHLAVEGADGLELTSTGHVVGTAAVDYVATVRTATDLHVLLNAVDADRLPAEIDVDLFRDAEMVRPRPAQPALPAQRVVELTESSTRLRGMSPVVLPSYVDAFYRKILDGTETELILSRQAVAALEESYPTELAAGMERGELDLLVVEELPFGLLITPDRSAIAAYDEDHVLRLLVESDREAFQSWTDDLYAAYRSEAEPYSSTIEE